MTQPKTIAAWLAVFWTLFTSASPMDSLYIRSLLNLQFARAAEHSRTFTEPERSQAAYDLGFVQSFLTGNYKDPAVSGEDFVDRLDRLGHQNAYAIKAEYHLKRAILAYYREETVTVGLAIYYSYKNSKKALAENPNDPHAKALHGLFLYLVGSIPADYRSWFSMIGISGDAKEGLRLMREVASRKPLTVTSAKTRLALSFFEIQEAASTAKLHHTHSPAPPGSAIQTAAPNRSHNTIDGLPASLIRTYLRSRLAYKIGDAKTSYTLLQNVIQTDSSVRMPYARLLMAKYVLASGDLGLATLYLDEFHQHYSGSDYQKAMVLYRGWIGLMRGDMDVYEVNRRKISEFTRRVMAEDIMADSESKRDHLPSLVQARMILSYRGPDEARDYLQSMDYNALSTPHRVEWLYLMARTEQQRGQFAKAKTSYLRLLQLPWFEDHFVPNALLQLAAMSISSSDFSSARDFLNRLDKYAGYPYEASIKWQAKQLRSSLK